MWKTHANEIEADFTMYRISENEKLLNFGEVISLLKDSAEFRQYWIDLLKNSPYEAYFWEVRPVSAKMLNKAFEFVLVRSTILNTIRADESAFEKYFKKGELVVCFPNLGGDAKLIVPTNISESENYGHLANFIRKAPTHQIEKFWKVVGEEYAASIDDRVKWISTAGLGIYWLHVRIDTTPKYYRYSPYKAIN